jgi:hypothetical protein
MNLAITADEAILMPNDTPNAESTSLEAYDLEITTADELPTEAGGLDRLTGEID